MDMVIDIDVVLEEKHKGRLQQLKYGTQETNILPKPAHKRLIFFQNGPIPLFLSMMNIREFCVYFTPGGGGGGADGMRLLLSPTSAEVLYVLLLLSQMF